MYDFAIALFQNLSFVPKKTKSSNEPLAKLTSDLIERKKKELTPLEKMLGIFRED